VKFREAVNDLLFYAHRFLPKLLPEFGGEKVRQANRLFVFSLPAKTVGANHSPALF